MKPSHETKAYLMELLETCVDNGLNLDINPKINYVGVWDIEEAVSPFQVGYAYWEETQGVHKLLLKVQQYVKGELLRTT